MNDSNNTQKENVLPHEISKDLNMKSSHENQHSKTPLKSSNQMYNFLQCKIMKPIKQQNMKNINSCYDLNHIYSFIVWKLPIGINVTNELNRTGSRFFIDSINPSFFDSGISERDNPFKKGDQIIAVNQIPLDSIKIDSFSHFLHSLSLPFILWIQNVPSACLSSARPFSTDNQYKNKKNRSMCESYQVQNQLRKIFYFTQRNQNQSSDSENNPNLAPWPLIVRNGEFNRITYWKCLEMTFFSFMKYPHQSFQKLLQNQLLFVLNKDYSYEIPSFNFSMYNNHQKRKKKIKNNSLNDKMISTSQYHSSDSCIHKNFHHKDNNIDIGSTVHVAKRTFPGMNKLGGVGFVKKIHLQDKMCFYDVKYILGGSEKMIPQQYLQLQGEDMSISESASSSIDKVEEKKDVLNQFFQVNAFFTSNSLARTSTETQSFDEIKEKNGFELSINIEEIEANLKNETTTKKIDMRPDDNQLNFSIVDIYPHIIWEEDEVLKELIFLQEQVQHALEHSQQHIKTLENQLIEQKEKKPQEYNDLLALYNYTSTQYMNTSLSTNISKPDEMTTYLSTNLSKYDEETTMKELKTTTTPLPTNKVFSMKKDGKKTPPLKKNMIVNQYAIKESCTLDNYFHPENNLLTPNSTTRIKKTCLLCLRDEDENMNCEWNETESGNYVHELCALYTPEVFYNQNDKVCGITKIPYERKKLKCHLCQSSLGSSKIQCAVKSCFIAFHVHCGFDNGLLNEQDNSFIAYCLKHQPSSKQKNNSVSSTTSILPSSLNVSIQSPSIKQSTSSFPQSKKKKNERMGPMDNAEEKNCNSPMKKRKINQNEMYEIGETVNVIARTWPGMNKLGGVGRVKAVFPSKGQEIEKTCYDVEYVIGGNEKNILHQYIEPMSELIHVERRRTRPKISK